jgi:arylsulfatase A-like enzyme
VNLSQNGRQNAGEGGTRVRGFVHSPNLLPASFVGTQYDGIVSGADVFPTLCRLAGVPVPEHTGPCVYISMLATSAVALKVPWVSVASLEKQTSHDTQGGCAGWPSPG